MRRVAGTPGPLGCKMDFPALERRRLAAIDDGDRGTLEELHHPDFVLCTPSGLI